MTGGCIGRHSSRCNAAISRRSIAGDPTGFELEVAEVERALRTGDTESPVVPLRDTVEILEIIDQARGQIGVRYPVDEE